MIIETCEIDLATDTGPMRVTLYEPAGKGRYPGLIFYSEIFQQTDPIRRVASLLAGHGFAVAVPEIFHELNSIGTVLAYDDAGKDKGNADKSAKTLEAHDHDTNVLVDCLRGRAGCTGKVGAMGICIGGHLAFRAALNDGVLAASCFYATDLHADTLACKVGNGTLERCAEIGGELQLVWGRQDPHTPTEGRAKIYQALSAAEVDFTWHEFNAQHAFIRDEGPRYEFLAHLRGTRRIRRSLRRSWHDPGRWRAAGSVGPECLRDGSGQRSGGARLPPGVRFVPAHAVHWGASGRSRTPRHGN